MLPGKSYIGNSTDFQVGQVHAQLTLRAGCHGARKAFRQHCNQARLAEGLLAAPVLQRPFIEGHAITSPLEDAEVPVLYTHTLCPYAHRAWLTLLEKVRSLPVYRAGMFF